MRKNIVKEEEREEWDRRPKKRKRSMRSQIYREWGKSENNFRPSDQKQSMAKSVIFDK